MRLYFLRGLMVAAAVGLSLAVWSVGNLHEKIFEHTRDEAHAITDLLLGATKTENALDRLLSRGDLAQAPSTAELERKLADVRSAVDVEQERRALAAVETVAQEYADLAEQTIFAVASGDRAAVSEMVGQRKAAFGELQGAGFELYGAIDDHRAGRQTRADVLLFSVIGGLSLTGLLVLLATERRIRHERRRRSTETQLTEILQVARSEDEAYRVLARHVERVVNGSSRAVVLNRNNSENRLEARTALADDSKLREALEGANPDSCLAIRLSKPHERACGDDQLMPCGVCGKLPSRSTCVPTLVGGEVIGSVLVEHDKELHAGQREQLATAVASAAPVIANLRSLAVAETRAATDALTGLANNRAIQDTLKRMVAHAQRSGASLAAILFDLDHFKQINDKYGHERGDEALAAVAAVAIASVRGSDFVGRWGGEEFVVLLPDTDRDGAFHVAEKMRAAFAEIELDGIERRLSASFGVAALPADAEDGPSLLRSADRALYRAKSNGRDRVELLVQGGESEPGLALVTGGERP